MSTAFRFIAALAISAAVAWSIHQSVRLNHEMGVLTAQLEAERAVNERCDRVVSTCLSWQVRVKQTLEAVAEACR